MRPITVSTLNNQIKSLLETSFTRVFVEGELSRITYHNSGHIYFSLKDETSTVRAVMFRGNATRLKFRLEEGQKVLIDAAITVYTPRGEYQLNCFSIEPSGIGALSFAFEQLKNTLAQKGYFDPARKKALPKFPQRVALITSATGAALQDMLRIAATRYPLTRFYLYDVLVQGESAAASIAAALKEADTKGYDAIVIARGGGSMEDLWAFNEEILADAIFKASTPVISAVGHEIDTVISDYVADVRAATPSNAMEILLPDRNELLIYIDTLITRFEQTINHIFSNKTQQLNHLRQSFEHHSIEKKLTQQLQQIQQLKNGFDQTITFRFDRYRSDLRMTALEFPNAIERVLRTKEAQLKNIQTSFETNDPKRKSKKGYAQIVKENRPIDLERLEPGDTFEAQTSAIILQAKVLTKKEILS